MKKGKKGFALKVCDYAVSMAEKYRKSPVYGKDAAFDVLKEITCGEKESFCLLVYILHRLIYVQAVTGCDMSEGLSVIREAADTLKEQAQRGSISVLVRKGRLAEYSDTKSRKLKDAAFCEWCIESVILAEKKGLKEAVRLLNRDVPGALKDELRTFEDDFTEKPYSKEPYEALAKKVGTAYCARIMQILFESACADTGIDRGAIFDILLREYLTCDLSRDKVSGGAAVMKRPSKVRSAPKSVKLALFTVGIIMAAATGAMCAFNNAAEHRSALAKRLRESMYLGACDAAKTALVPVMRQAERTGYDGYEDVTCESITADFLAGLAAVTGEDTELYVDIIEADAAKGIISASIRGVRDGEIPVLESGITAVTRVTAQINEDEEPKTGMTGIHSCRIVEISGGSDSDAVLEVNDTYEEGAKAVSKPSSPGSRKEEVSKSEQAAESVTEPERAAESVTEPERAAESAPESERTVESVPDTQKETPAEPESADASKPGAQPEADAEADIRSDSTKDLAPVPNVGAQSEVPPSYTISITEGESWYFSAENIKEIGKLYISMINTEDLSAKQAQRTRICDELFRGKYSSCRRTNNTK